MSASRRIDTPAAAASGWRPPAPAPSPPHGAVPAAPRTQEPAARRRSRSWAAVLALVLVMLGTAWTWTEVVTRLRDPQTPATRGTPAGVVWANRVFRSEAEMAAWFGHRGLRYERWARTHPRAAAILRSARLERAPTRPPARRA